MADAQVVSDIDDTLMCSGGNFPAGSDTRYPKGCVYPGVLAFYRGLDATFALRLQVLPGLLKVSASSECRIYSSTCILTWRFCSPAEQATGGEELMMQQSAPS